MKSVLYLSIVLVFLSISSESFAHGVRGTIVSNAGILVSVEYDDGEPLGYGAVDIFCSDEKLPFQTGRTDRNGRFIFLPDKPGDWQVIVKDAMGHQLRLKADIDENNVILIHNDNSLQQYPRYLKALTGIALLSVIFSFLFFLKVKFAFPGN